jgi:hypothetical protein
MKKILAILVVCALAFVAPAAFAEETIDSPVYQSWAKFKVGAMAKYKQEMTL